MAIEDMADVISLEAWRSGRRQQAPPGARRAHHRKPERRDADIARLERAVRRLDVLARPDTDRDRLAPDVEHALLTIVGELAMGWLDQAAERAARLCDRLAAGQA
jgi:hypothetical protein